MNVKLISYTQEPESGGDFKSLEHATFTFLIEGISRAYSYQLVRHSMASSSLQSHKYITRDRFDFIIPESIETSDVEIYDNVFPEYDDGDIPLGECYRRLMELIGDFYGRLVEEGISEEDARYVLPNACCTNLVIIMNACELKHFFSLRCCEKAQWEIKQVAEKMLARVKEVAPSLFEDAGAQCKALGYCPEANGCGRYPKKVKE